MKIKDLEAALSSPEMPMLVAHNGLALKVYEWLLTFCQGRISETELEDLLAAKLENAELSLEQMETMEYPDQVRESHLALYQIFQTYQQSLMDLSEQLWGEPDPDIPLGKVFHSLIRCDRDALNSQAALDKKIDGIPALGLTW